MKKIGFTLAEVMIVLVVIGVITGILLPTAIQSTPDENVMKFKKGYSTLGQVIRELVTSDKYYKDGDLGIHSNGKQIDGSNEGDTTYFCNTFADVLNIKNINCSEYKSATRGYGFLSYDPESTEAISNLKSYIDYWCKTEAKNVGAEITTSDDIIFYSSNPYILFGMTYGQSYDETTNESDTRRMFGGVNDKNGFGRIYKAFCMDVDGIDNGEAPFGFGLRADGKILPGNRADEWINKSVQKGDE